MLLWRVYMAGNNTTYFGLHVMCPVFLSNFNQIWIFSTDFLKSPRIRFNGNLSSESRSDTYLQTDVTKLIGAFRDYANAPSKWVSSSVKYTRWQRTHLLCNAACFVKRSGERRSTLRNAWHNLFRLPALRHCRRSCLSCRARDLVHRKATAVCFWNVVFV
jgi:hypothetical protein